MWAVYLGVGLALAYAAGLAVMRQVYLVKHPLVARQPGRKKAVDRVFVGFAFVCYAVEGAVLAADDGSTLSDAVFLYVLTTLTLAYVYWRVAGWPARRAR